MKHARRLVFSVLSLLTGCAAIPAEPIATVQHVDLPRFMGRWYVIASIPTFLEKDAYGAIESYELNADGTVATTFTFHNGSLDGPLKSMTPRGTVRSATNATWAMQFLWPFKAKYLIAYVDSQHSVAIIARSKRDYVWIMARTPRLSTSAYQELEGRVGALGYDLSKLRCVPQVAGVTPLLFSDSPARVAVGSVEHRNGHRP